MKLNTEVRQLCGQVDSLRRHLAVPGQATTERHLFSFFLHVHLIRKKEAFLLVQ